jgi:hypothetical protein
MGVRRWFLGAPLVAALALVAPAAAMADAPLLPSGALIYSWHGDPARGCAGVGVCGIEGTLIVRPQVSAFLTQPSKRPSGFIDLADATATVRVRRTEAGSSGDCVDTGVWPTVGDESLQIKWRRGGAAVLSPSRIDGPSSGHCAGPLPSQLPTRIVGRRLHGRAVRFRFLDTITFGAGPYSGTLVSTLAFLPDTSSGFSSASGESSSPGRVTTALDERVALTYRVAVAGGKLRATLLGERDPFCAALDACATSGAMSLSFGARHETMTVIADRIVRRRIGRAAALTDFRARRLLLNIPVPGAGGSYASTETLSRAGGATCTAATPGRENATSWLGSPFEPPPFVVGPNGPSRHAVPRRQPRAIAVLMTIDDPADALRTDCAGPNGSDVFGANGVVGRGVVDFGHLLRPRFKVVLRPAERFSALGYSGSISGALTLTMSLVKVRAGTVREPA